MHDIWKKLRHFVQPVVVALRNDRALPVTGVAATPAYADGQQASAL
jgi:hypothetical protein